MDRTRLIPAAFLQDRPWDVLGWKAGKSANPCLSFEVAGAEMEVAKNLGVLLGCLIFRNSQMRTRKKDHDTLGASMFTNITRVLSKYFKMMEGGTVSGPHVYAAV